MPLYLCRWPNGDFSFVSAANKEAAVEILDEIGNAEGCPLRVVKEFMVHFYLADEGTFEFEGFGEVTQEAIWKIYPILDQTLDQIVEDNPNFELQGPRKPEEEKKIEGAVKRERERVEAKKVREPQTEIGRRIKGALGAPTSMIDKAVSHGAKELLKEFTPKGKPN